MVPFILVIGTICLQTEAYELLHMPVISLHLLLPNQEL